MAKMKEMLDAMIRGDLEQPPVSKLVGFNLAECEDGKAVVKMKTGVQHYNPMSTVHGGVLCDLADAAMGIAFATTLDEGESFTTIDLQISFLRAVREARLTATADVVKRGRNIGYVECEVVDHDGKLVAKSASNCMVLRS